MPFGSREREEFEAHVEQLNRHVQALERDNADLRSANTDLQQLHETDKAVITQLEEVTDANRSTIDDLREQVENNKVANEIGAYALIELKKAEASGEVRISADEGVKETVAKRLIQQVAAEQTDQLITAKEQELREEYGPERIAEIRSRIDATFNGDGTYTRLKKTVDKSIRDDIRAELLAGARTQLETELNIPENRAKMVAEERAKLDEAGTFEAEKQKIIQAAKQEWKEGAIAAAQADMAAEIEAERAHATDKYKQTYRRSGAGVELRTKLHVKALRQWEKVGAEEVAREIKDEETLAVLTELNQKNKNALLAKKEYEEHLADFFKGGIHTDEIPKDSVLTILLGSIKKTHSYGELYTLIVANRLICLTSLGQGRYLVDVDSLSASDNAYERSAALDVGKVVHIGRMQQTKEQPELSYRLSYNVPMAIDGDTDDERLEILEYPVVDVKLNKAYAQKGDRLSRELRGKTIT